MGLRLLAFWLVFSVPAFPKGDSPPVACQAGYQALAAPLTYEDWRLQSLARVRERFANVQDLRVREDGRGSRQYKVEILRQGRWKEIGGLDASFEHGVLSTSFVHIDGLYRYAGLYRLLTSFAVEADRHVEAVSAQWEGTNAAAFAVTFTGAAASDRRAETVRYEDDVDTARATARRVDEVFQKSLTALEAGRDFRERCFDAYRSAPAGRANADVGFENLEVMHLELFVGGVSLPKVQAARRAPGGEPRLYVTRYENGKAKNYEVTAEGAVVALRTLPLF